jgi:hypothetical protein
MGVSGMNSVDASFEVAKGAFEPIRVARTIIWISSVASPLHIAFGTLSIIVVVDNPIVQPNEFNSISVHPGPYDPSIFGTACKGRTPCCRRRRVRGTLDNRGFRVAINRPL